MTETQPKMIPIWVAQCEDHGVIIVTNMQSDIIGVIKAHQDNKNCKADIEVSTKAEFDRQSMGGIDKHKRLC